MWALIDCNSFFCSVEKVFHPGLNGKPVCVLSSNDGNIVALTPEAKALGLHRGDPVFKVKSILEANKVNIFSSNLMLYAAMSRRILSILRKEIMQAENYSIDESFCNLHGYEKMGPLDSFMRNIVEKIRLYTDIPVSVGIAPSKTLAKMGSKYAKQYAGYRSVCLIDTEEKRRKALELFDLADVWGIGPRTFDKLCDYGIRTPLELADKSETWVKQRFSLPMVRTWHELNGRPCIDTTENNQKQSICTSRSFGQMITELDDLKASVANFAASCANKLRGQHSVAKAVTVFVMSNRFREDMEQYYNSATYLFEVPTADTIEITEAAMQVTETLYKKGIWYKKSGVVLSEIASDKHQVGHLFDTIQNRPERRKLMDAIDTINQRYGVHTVQLAVAGSETEEWKSKSEQRSPNYLTDLDDILTIQI